MRRWMACAAAAAALLTSAAAFPCGAPFGNNITVDPHQDIIIAWKSGVETYVFQPTFCGTASDFGLILPVPALLSQNPTIMDQEAFTTAIRLSAPKQRQVTQSRGGFGCGSNSRAGGGMAQDNGAAVVASGRVGFLDWVQLKADSEADFTNWLTNNGYPYSSSASSVFSYYVSKGWYFLAFRINQNVAPDGGTVCQALGPVAVSFPTDAPVVPSRMAGAGGASSYQMSWRIFGITAGDSQLSLQNATDQYGGLWYSGTIQPVDAPSFGGLAQPGDRLTRLVLSFYAVSATADESLTLAQPADYRGTEDIIVYDSSACSVRPHHRLPSSRVLCLFGLATLGLFLRRRRR